jgi:mono/diheme cytochrome c family protein
MRTAWGPKMHSLLIRLIFGAGAFGAAAAITPGVAADSAVERGKYLVTIGICGSCHQPNLAGGRRTGGILSANITSDKETGIGGWSRQQIVDAIRNGKRPDGSQIRPPMGIFFYRELSDRDAQAIADYLLTVPPVRVDFKHSPVSGPVPEIPPPAATVPDTPAGDTIAHGKYLAVTVAHCMQCHSPKAAGLPDLARMGAGGNGYRAADGRTALSANITPGNPDGIVKWTDEDLKKAITTGVRPDGSHMVPVMDFEFYSQMTAADLDALVRFLRTLKPVPPA